MWIISQTDTDAAGEKVPCRRHLTYVSSVLSEYC
jgi:hypothetical protein